MIKKIFSLSLLSLCFSFKADKSNLVCTATWYDTSGHPKVHREHSTAAFNLYPKGTMLLVKNLSNNKVDTVEITDKHNAGHNHIDLSKTSFSKLASLKQGKIKVSVEKIN